MKIALRDRFPELKVETTKGSIQLPGDYAGKWFILFSHPADFTPVCTTEFVSFQKKMKQFNDLGVELIGLSVDSLESHHQWIQWIKDNIHVQIEFPVIDDEKRVVAETLGLIHPNEDETVAVRAVIIVDHNGKVRTILEYPKEIGRNIDEILRTAKALKMASIKKVFAPANWPHNEIIGDKVLFHREKGEDKTSDKECGIYSLADWFEYKNVNEND
ncbi:peroxiredoxin [Sinanaerobacter sp. ZZT-01]|jgi:peroxiredoxin 2/4|uniref:peroxiredoxin n=1 Tax=Sinanaerobacter sp. ZZT-01 TaxID=3111540 RepID=UPI002D79DCF7|nr:peroxiredoxin [Sinanaerobacter sp. ZZT-01]WRR93628.1 peroxiredoxin [Sinanaerobacter sp. ZZT-01]